MIELKQGAARVLIDPEAGGRLASLQLYGRELLVARTTNPLHWGCYPMAPWAGRVRDGRFTFEDVEHALPLTMAPHAIHGTAWDRAWKVDRSSRETDEETSCSLQIGLGDDWPFAGRARQRIQLLEDCLRLELTVHAHAEPFPASIGWHPWFRRDLGEGGSAALSFDAEAMYAVDAQQIPTGELRTPTPGPWDDCFCGVETEPELRWRGFLALTLHSSLDHWVVYDQPEHALCVEPMSGPPNALNGQPRAVTPELPLSGVFEMHWRRC